MKSPDFIPLVLFAIFLAVSVPSRAAVTGTRVQLADSIKEVPSYAPESEPHRVRETLTAAESAESLNFVVSLRMRNYAEFESAVQSGRTPSQAEMEARYLPLKADYDRVAAWLVGQGFATTLVDANHTNLFVRGTVANIAGSLNVSFARVATADGEFTSAVTAPYLPAELASAVLGIDGLQPHIRMHAPKPRANTGDSQVAHPTRAIPSDLLTAYNVPANLNGAGQTMAIFAPALPLESDLTTFYQLTGTNEIPTKFTVVPINGGPISGAYTLNEVTLDTEWSTGIAPRANLRVYATPDGTLTSFEAACTQVLNDGLAKTFSSSYSSPETNFAAASLQASSQILAQMAAAGITVFHGAGDSGAYSADVAPEYPTTDPYVTALGGTQMTFDTNWNETSETVWPNTGGGYSTFFSQPSWQAGPGVPVGTMRCIPDAAATSWLIAADGMDGGFIVLNGSTSTGIGGDSATGPIWSGLTAIINQARANAGLPPVGLLGPKIYPLIGKNTFNDITVGSDGAYSAGPGYDLCSGVGTPNMTNLVAALTTVTAPSITSQASSQSVATGRSAAFNVIASGAPAPTYQWTLNGSTTIPGATVTTDPILWVSGTTSADAGTYVCTATNGSGTATSTATLTVTTTPGYLTNLSGRGQVGVGAANALTGGFGITGTGSKQLLIRGIGPGLNTAFGLTGELTATSMTLNNSSRVVIDQNQTWGGTTTLMNVEAAVGAFSVPANSLDSMLDDSEAVGGYTAAVTGPGNVTGLALVEIYDADANPPAARLNNVSVRAPVGTGSNILIGGFVIGGSTAETVLIRAMGPSLNTVFGLTGELAQPVLTLYNSNNAVIYSNTIWGGDPVLVAAQAQVGAYAVPNSSQDSMLLVTLPADGYSAQVAGVNGTTGIAAVEIYEVY